MNNAYRDGYINERFNIPKSIIEEVIPDKKETITYKEIEEAHNNLANILDAKGKIEEAKKHYKKALSIDPENAKIHNNLGALFQAEKEYLKSINHLQKALQLKPDFKEARQSLSIVMEQYRKAEAKRNK